MQVESQESGRGERHCSDRGAVPEGSQAEGEAGTKDLRDGRALGYVPLLPHLKPQSTQASHKFSSEALCGVPSRLGDTR
jgi:hypothetical protein